MKNKKINSVLNEVLEKINPSKEDLKLIENELKGFLENFRKEIKSKKISAEVFVGGSFAKKTFIKKNYYDIDVFVRFDKKYDEKQMSELLKKLLQKFGNFEIVHGSRDYFRIKKGEDFFVELIPVRIVKNPKEATNITDLSYSHVKYINKKIKSKKILNDIKLAKAFCHANKCYGAESYIQGFSGYSLELLVFYYGSFLKFLREMAKVNLKEKLIIDIEKYFKPKKNVLIDLNTSKLNSPIILIDPTYKQRNVLAALSNETFLEFQKSAKKFLKNPSLKSFEVKKQDFEKLKKQAHKKNQEFVLMSAKTSKEKVDVLASKLLKFYKHLREEISKFYEIKKTGFEYECENQALYFFVLKKKNFVLYPGPFKDDKKNVLKFKKEHKQIFEKKKKLYARERVNLSGKEFVNKWKNKNKRKIKEMSISDLQIIDSV